MMKNVLAVVGAISIPFGFMLAGAYIGFDICYQNKYREILDLKQENEHRIKDYNGIAARLDKVLDTIKTSKE